MTAICLVPIHVDMSALLDGAFESCPSDRQLNDVAGAAGARFDRASRGVRPFLGGLMLRIRTGPSIFLPFRRIAQGQANRRAVIFTAEVTAAAIGAAARSGGA